MDFKKEHLSDLVELRDWLRDQIDGATESQGRDTRISGFIASVDFAIDLVVALDTAIKKEAKKFARLLGPNDDYHVTEDGEHIFIPRPKK